MIDREKHKKFLTDFALMLGNFDGLINLLESGEEIPPLTRFILSNMFKDGSSGTELQLVVRRRDGKRGRPKMTFENYMDKVELGRRVINLRKAPGDYDAAIHEAAKEFKVSDRTARSAYSLVKKIWEERARINNKRKGFRPNPDASNFDLFALEFE
jgi:hypothetical protein